MASDYEDWDKACKRIRRENEKLLDEFEGWLAAANLTDNTIRKHIGNVELYINHYLLEDDALEARDGVSEITGFLGYWFIRKAMWASAAAIKENAAGLKKFYTFMEKTGRVDADELQTLKEAIKEEMPAWIARLERYDDLSITDSADIWGM